MPRTPRKYYKPRSRATKDKIRLGNKAYHERCRKALALLDEQERQQAVQA